jgi:hypothetical protein
VGGGSPRCANANRRTSISAPGRSRTAASSARTSAGARSCRWFSSRDPSAATRRWLRKIRSSPDTPAYVTQQEDEWKGCLKLRIRSCFGQTPMNRQPLEITREHREIPSGPSGPSWRSPDNSSVPSHRSLRRWSATSRSFSVQ